MMLSEYDIELIHVPRMQMVQSDALFRRPDYVLGEDTDKKDITILPDKLFIQVADTSLRDLIVEASL